MSLPLFPSFRRQQLVLDFSSLKHSCPEGIYLTLPPENPSLWSGVLFVRKGPYESAILRFQIYFPDTYPELPPLITFSTDVFHPLIVPLTTYTFSTGVLDAAGTVSASDEQRLPPGSFSLRYAFPHWFGGVDQKNVTAGGDISEIKGEDTSIQNDSVNSTNLKASELAGDRTLVIKVLEHIKAAFEDEALLDNLTLETAGNPSAWHAWKAHQGLSVPHERSKSAKVGDTADTGVSPRHPGSWKWDGVWESRVSEGIQLSINEATLFGTTLGRTGPTSIDPVSKVFCSGLERVV